MKCPLFTEYQDIESGERRYHMLDCLKEECAWWDKDGNQCSHLAEMKVLVNIESCLELIVNKMPHEEQFRR